MEEVLKLDLELSLLLLHSLFLLRLWTLTALFIVGGWRQRVSLPRLLLAPVPQPQSWRERDEEQVKSTMDRAKNN